jgi:hypothetical protein
MAQRTETGIISGVISDGETRLPLGGAVVSIMAAERRVGAIPRTLSDALGRFVVRGVPAGSYTLGVSRIGYFPEGYAGGGRIRLKPGQWFSDANVSLEAHSELSGSVVDESGVPVIGAWLVAMPQVAVAGVPYTTCGLTAQSDDLGQYRIGALGPGDYLVRGTIRPAGLPAQPLTSNGSGQPSFLGEPVSLAVGEVRRGVDFQIRRMATFAVSGTLSGQTRLIADAKLRLVAATGDGAGCPNIIATTTADGQGAFEFVAVPPGRYVVEVTTKATEFHYSREPSLITAAPRPEGGAFEQTIGLSPRGLTAWTDRWNSDSQGVGRAEIEVGALGPKNLVVPVQQAFRLSGRVAFEAASQAGTENAVEVSLEPANGDVTRGFATAVVDTDGRFNLPVDSPGRYFVRATATGFVTRTVYRNNLEVSDAAIEIGTGEASEDVQILMTDRSAAFTGNVLPISGAPRSPAVVVVYPFENDRWLNFGLRPPRVAVVAASTDGAFEVRGLPAGDYLAVALDPDVAQSWPASGFFRRMSPLATRVRLDWGGTTVQDLTVRPRLK